MKLSLTLFALVCLAFVFTAQAQNKRRQISQTSENPNLAIVADERLAVLRTQPSLYADTVQRMRTGKIMTVTGAKQADGVTFYRVVVPPRNYGWVQKEAFVVKNKKGDDLRLAQLIQASEGFDRLERGVIFLDYFPNSALRPSMLLLLGDLAEETAQKLTRDVTRNLDKREMAGSDAPSYSFFLSHVSLERYRKIGIKFVFNVATNQFHYDGATWNEILTKYPKTNEASEARKRLDSLKEKMETKKAKSEK